MEVIVLKYADWFFLCVSVKNFSCVWTNKLINVFHRADMSCMANERGIFPSLFYPGPASFANVDDDFVIRKCL